MDFYSQKNNLNQRKINGTGSKIPELNGFKKNGLNKYEDPTGMFTNRQFRLASWYVKNKILLYRILVAILIVFSAVTLAYSFLKIAWILIVEGPRDKQSLQEMTQFEDYDRLNRILVPQPLMLGEPASYMSGVGKYDLAVEITNQNTKHIAYFNYYFVVDGATTTKRAGFVLPMETKLFAEYGLNDVSGVNLIVENISFQRINAHLYSDPVGFIAARNLFSVSNLDFKSVLHPQGANANIIKFDLTNDSPFNYYSPKFTVEFKNNGGAVGVSEINVKNFVSLETRSVDLRSFADNLSVDEVYIYPSINYFERSEYFEPIR